jgi:hypothetical protein
MDLTLEIFAAKSITLLIGKAEISNGMGDFCPNTVLI